MSIKIGDNVQIIAENGYMLEPQVASVVSFHTENGWKESHGWVWLEVKEVGQLLFWPSEYKIIEEVVL